MIFSRLNTNTFRLKNIQCSICYIVNNDVIRAFSHLSFSAVHVTTSKDIYSAAVGARGVAATALKFFVVCCIGKISPFRCVVHWTHVELGYFFIRVKILPTY